MILGFLVFLDVLTIFVLVTSQFGFVRWEILLYHGSYMVGKGLWYPSAIASWIDILIGIWIFAIMLGATSIPITAVACAWLLIKTISYFSATLLS